MFQNKRYATRGVMEIIPIWLQMEMWRLVDKRVQSSKKVDYLQIFELYPTYEDSKRVQGITHRQEQPKYQKKHTIRTDDTVFGKVWIIDSNEYSTMLLPDEY